LKIQTKTARNTFETTETKQ